MMRGLVIHLILAVASAQVFLPDRPFQLHGPPLKPAVPPRIYSIRGDVYIYHGYAKTTVEYVMFNLDDSPMDVEFAHSFPPNAYITDFQIKYGNGVVKRSEVRDRDHSGNGYVDATHGGIKADAHKNSRHALNFGHSNYFGASTYVKSFENVTFRLQYEELLQPKFGKYEYQLELRPQEVVEFLNVIVRIADTKKIMSVETPGIVGVRTQSKGNPFADVTVHERFATVIYSPTKWEQRDYHSKGINGIIRIKYQTEHANYGDYKIGKNHFAYYFSPNLRVTLQKHLILVMDTSDSMVPVESQLTAAMQSLMSTLVPGDKYTVIEFASSLRIWKGDKFVDPKQDMFNVEDFSIVLQGEQEDSEAAEYAVRRISEAKQSTFQRSGTDTDLNMALDAAMSIAQSTEPDEAIPFIVLLTDGKVSAGERNFEKIIHRTRQMSRENVPIFSLAMGEKAEERFLSRLSSENYGFSIRIKETDPDVSSQLHEFQKLLQPIVGSLTMDFKDFAVHDSVSTYTFRSHFRGAEKIVTGKLIEPQDEGSVVVYMNVAEGSTSVEQNKKYEGYEYGPNDSDSFLERIWAYNTIKDMIKKIANSDSSPELHHATTKGTELSLKYNFVSEFTSLLVKSQGYQPYINLDTIINLNGYSWSDEGPVRETRPQAQFGFLGGLALPFLPQIVPFHQLVKDDLRQKFDWPVQIGIDGTAFLQNGKTLRLGFGKVNLPYGDSCTTKKGHEGTCKLVHFCQTEDYSREFDLFTENTCKYLDANIYDGVCCPVTLKSRSESEDYMPVAPGEGTTSSVTTDTSDFSTTDFSTMESAPDTTITDSAFTASTEATEVPEAREEAETTDNPTITSTQGTTEVPEVEVDAAM